MKKSLLNGHKAGSIIKTLLFACLIFFSSHTLKAQQSFSDVTSTVNSVSFKYSGKTQAGSAWKRVQVWFYGNDVYKYRYMYDVYSWLRYVSFTSPLITLDCKDMIPNSTVKIKAICYHYNEWYNYIGEDEPLYYDKKLADYKPLSNVQATDGLYGDRINIKWDINEKFYKHQYFIRYFKDDVWKDTEILPAGTKTYTIYKSDLEPVEKLVGSRILNFYVAPIVNNHYMDGDKNEGSRFDINFQVGNLQTDRVVFSWNNYSKTYNAGGYSISRYEEGNKNGIEVASSNENYYTSAQDNDQTLTPGYKYTYKIQTNPVTNNITGEVIGFIKRNGTIRGAVTTPAPSVVGVGNIKMVAKLIGNTLPTDTAATYITYTDGDGKYVFNNIYYCDEASFTVMPEDKTRKFGPDTPQEVMLKKDNYTVSNINFTDSTSFIVSGKITQNGCPVDSVSVLLDGVDNKVKTKNGGMYQLPVSIGGKHTIKPEFKDKSKPDPGSITNHTFSPAERTLNVTSNMVNIDFTDTTEYVVDGYFTASCGTYIGQATLQFKDKNNCIKDIIKTDGKGYYSVLLPARKYWIELIDFSSDPENENLKKQVKEYFANSDSIDLTFRNTLTFRPDTLTHKDTLAHNFIYREKPKLKILGMDIDKTCSGDPIMQQFTPYQIELIAEESFGGNTCFAESGYVIITENISSIGQGVDNGLSMNTATLYYNKEDTMKYTLIPGTPNIVDTTHIKSFQAILYIGNQTDTVIYNVIVTGHRPRNLDYVTVTPQIPFDILHDPPGDGSYSYLEEGQSTSSSLTISSLTDSSQMRYSDWQVWPTVSVSIDFPGGGLSIDVGAGYEGSKSWSEGVMGLNAVNSVITTTYKNRYQTTVNPDVTGTNGDLYIGAAVNLIYGITDQILYDFSNCRLIDTISIAYSPVGISTGYVYSEGYIVDSEIPRLKSLITYSESIQDYEMVDSLTIQVNTWDSIICKNHDNIEKATKIEDGNISFNGGGSEIEKSFTTEIDSSSTIETSFIIDKEVVHHFGGFQGGLGVGGGWINKTQITFDTIRDNTINNTRTVGYVLRDDDAGDHFSFDVATDTRYQTPAFKNVVGSSSCPWDPRTLPREGVQLSCKTNYQEVEESEEAVFVLTLANTSQSDEKMTYYLIFDHTSNPDGAQLTIGGSQVVGNVPYPYEIEPGNPVNATITVRKGPIENIYEYKGLKFVLTSGCDDDQISSEVLLNAVFYKNYDLTVAKVGEGTTYPATGITTYKMGASVYLEATPAVGYKFEKWVVNSAVYSDPTISIFMNEATTATAYFVENKHFTTVWDGTPGQNHMNINIIDAKYGGLDLETGDEIGIFDGNLCVGYGKLTKTIDQKNILSINVSKDDGTGNGYTAGNEVIYRIWDCSADEEYVVSNIQCFDNQLNTINCLPFTAGESAFVKLWHLGELCHTIDFKTGWNIFSVPSWPDLAEMDNLFQPIISNSSLIKIQDETGNSLENWGIFGGWKNNIPEISPTEGYKVKVSAPGSFEVCGTPVEYPYAVELKTGWNIMGFPQTKEYNAKEVVQQLIDNKTLIKVQDELGNSIEDWGIFGGWVNNIGNFVPGKGFNIKVRDNEILWINSNYAKSSMVLPEQIATIHFKTVYQGNGVDHMNINLVGLPISLLRTGDELAVFDGETCVGAVTIMPFNLNSKTISVIASAADLPEMRGFEEGNPFILKLWNSKNNQEIVLEPEILIGSETFEKNETTLASLEKYIATGLERVSSVSEINCYPNPFSNEINIELKLIEKSELQIEVLNQLGQTVKHIITKQFVNEGLHNFVWNGTNQNSQAVSPGMYYLTVKENNSVFHQKIVFSK